jgi:hypothetical protein
MTEDHPIHRLVPQAILPSHTLICQASLLALRTDEFPFVRRDRLSSTNFAKSAGQIIRKASENWLAPWYEHCTLERSS